MEFISRVQVHCLLRSQLNWIWVAGRSAAGLEEWNTFLTAVWLGDLCPQLGNLPTVLLVMVVNFLVLY